MQRRNFLKISAAATGIGLTGLGLHNLISKPVVQGEKNIVFIMLSGGMDGLSVVYPSDEKHLEALRPNIFLRTERALDWNGYRVHPLLADWRNLWDQKKLAFIHQFGAGHTRSHTEDLSFAQTFVPSSSPQQTSLLQIFRDHKICNLEDYKSACYFTTMQPKLFRTSVKPIMVNPDFLGSLRGGTNPGIDNAIFESYRGASSPIAVESLNAVIKARTELKHTLATFKNENASSSYLGTQLNTLSNMMLADVPVKLSYVESIGWDTHSDQGVHDGVFSKNLADLVHSVNVFLQKIGPKIENTLIVIQSEFGRTVAENGSLATDHGGGGLCMLIGGGVRGGNAFGPWKSLITENLLDGRDLPMTTDTRDFWGHILQNYFHKDIPETVFPDHRLRRLNFDLFS